jgi:hypothetical protein
MAKEITVDKLLSEFVHDSPSLLKTGSFVVPSPYLQIKYFIHDEFLLFHKIRK